MRGGPRPEMCRQRGAQVVARLHAPKNHYLKPVFLGFVF